MITVVGLPLWLLQDFYSEQTFRRCNSGQVHVTHSSGVLVHKADG